LKIPKNQAGSNGVKKRGNRKRMWAIKYMDTIDIDRETSAAAQIAIDHRKSKAHKTIGNRK
jgi:hypothetical protein